MRLETRCGAFSWDAPHICKCAGTCADTCVFKEVVKAHFLGSQRLGSATSRVLSYDSRMSFTSFLAASSTSVASTAAGQLGSLCSRLGLTYLGHVEREHTPRLGGMR